MAIECEHAALMISGSFQRSAERRCFHCTICAVGRPAGQSNSVRGRRRLHWLVSTAAAARMEMEAGNVVVRAEGAVERVAIA